jgi:integrase
MEGAQDPDPVEDLRTGEYLAQWLLHARGRVRGKTYEGYEGVIRLYATPSVGDIPLGDLHPLHLQRLYGELLDRGLSGGTVLNLHLVLRQALAQAVRWRLLTHSPAEGAQPPRPRRPEPAVIDPALATRILAAVAGTPMKLPCAVALATGMRRGEILALKWKDMDPRLTVAHVRHALHAPGGGSASRIDRGGRWFSS